MSTSAFLPILEFVLAFGILIFLHELGHFIMARINKIPVEEFGFGYPPRLVKLFTWKGTLFSLNCIPFGGFVRMQGENDPDVPGGFSTANPWSRLAVLLFGPVMNVLLGVVIFTVIFTRIGAPDPSHVVIVGVNENSPAETSGIEIGDIVLEMNGTQITSMDSLSQIVRANLDQPIVTRLERGSEVIEVTVTPRSKYPEGQGPMGIAMNNPNRPVTWIQSWGPSIKTAAAMGKQMLLLPVSLIRGQISPEQNRLVSVVGIYDIYGQIREQDKEIAEAEPRYANMNTLWFIGMLSVLLGFTNLLPLPALDGGRILFLVPELALRKRVPAKFENAVHFIGFAALLVLMVILVINDILNPVVLP